MSSKKRGNLIIIGGHEDREAKDEQTILKQVAQRAIDGNGRLALVTVASQEPEALIDTYVPLFKKLGLKQVDVLDIRTREDAYSENNLGKMVDAEVIFFTGGDQLRITSQIGDSPIYRCMQERYHQGATIAGTSAGAAAMPETMLISGPGDESNRISALGMAPGLALISNVVIDSHFAQRGRMGRLLGAVSQNPRNLGLGIDEDTAILVETDNKFRVLGSGAVYVLDGSTVTYSSLSQENPEGILTIHNVKLHVLGENDCFDLVNRRPLLAPQ